MVFQKPVAIADIRPPATGDALLIRQEDTVLWIGAYVLPRSVQHLVTALADLQDSWPAGHGARFQSVASCKESGHTPASGILLVQLLNGFGGVRQWRWETL